ncbi:hypothetical protein CR916_02790 [Escherichia coli]|nr:hypothetical protein CR916_02790 [Escherichia coli]
MHDEFGNKTATNLPEHDPDIASAGYYGAESRGDGNWTTASGQPILALGAPFSGLRSFCISNS